MAKRSDGLTRRQLAVLKLVSQFLTNNEIAESLGITCKTVELHVSRAIKRLKAKNRHHAVEIARKQGYLDS